jgi:transposase
MTQTASRGEYSGERKLYLALELGWREWKLAFAMRVSGRVFEVLVRARDRRGLEGAMDRARGRFGLPAGCEVVSCYEAGRDGFWLDRWLRSQGIGNVVVDSSSIEVNRRMRRIKTDRIDAAKLVGMLMRYDLGERKVWSVVRVPSEQQEDRRHLHRELRTLKKERTRLSNRIKGLLASQGVDGGMGRNGLVESLEGIRIWDGSALPEGLRGRLEMEIARHAFVHRQVLFCEAELKRVMSKSSEAAAADVRRLAGLRAIGSNGATILVREFGWRDFRNRRQVGALAGLAPTPFQSGKSFREGGISRAGNRHVRGVIVDLAWSWLRYQPGSELSEWYRKRFGSGGSRVRRIGIVALARKLLVALWRYWAQGEIPRGAVLKSSAG